MGLALHSHEMPHLIPVMQDPETSLTFLVEDLQAGRAPSHQSGADIEAWLTVLHRQGRPMIASTQGRANLEAWLALVEG